MQECDVLGVGVIVADCDVEGELPQPLFDGGVAARDRSEEFADPTNGGTLWVGRRKDHKGQLGHRGAGLTEHSVVLLPASTARLCIWP